MPVVQWFNLTLIHNKGAAFGLLSQAGGWQVILFVSIALFVSVVVIVGLVRYKVPLMQVIALALILGGALSNVLDRVLFGYVIDFLDFYIRHWHWPAFNLADAAICSGGFLLVLSYIRGY